MIKLRVPDLQIPYTDFIQNTNIIYNLISIDTRLTDTLFAVLSTE